VSLPSPHPHEDVAAIGHAHFVGLDRLVTTLIGRPLTAGNLVIPLQDGDEAYPAMLEAIANAKRSVAMSSYIFDDDESGRAFMDALVSAHRRGVQVRVLVDAVGVRYSKHSSVDKLHRLGFPRRFSFRRGSGPFPVRQSAQPPQDSRGGRLRRFHRRHEHPRGPCPLQFPKYPIRCLIFVSRGRSSPIFCGPSRSIGPSLRAKAFPGRPGPFPANARAGYGPRHSRWSGYRHRQYAERHPWALAAARSSVRVVTPYFLPDGALEAALKICALRGVPVDIVLPSHSNIFVMDWAMLPQLSGLIESGCRVCLSPPPFDHAKIFVVDRVWSLIGSTNWDPRSLRLNFEYNLECYDAELAGKLDDMAAARIDRARRLSSEELHALPTIIASATD